MDKMRKSILVLERDATLRATLVSMLHALSYNASGFERAQQIYDVLDSVMVNVLVISLESTDLDGVHIATTAKHHQDGLKVVVIDWREPPEKLRPQVDQFLQKPFSIEALRQTIESIS